MGEMDPVHWDDIVAVTGPPAPAIRARIDEMASTLREEAPYDAVKAVHDSFATDPGEESNPPDQGEVYIVTYLLERDGVINPSDTATGVIPSVVDRRPGGEQLRELFWEPPRTMWWVATQLGVHWALVRYWLYEEGIPLRERNFSDETMERIRAHREGRA